MATFWAGVLGLALALYVILDGFDLGIGILFAFAPDEKARKHMMRAIAPVWDGNETWLVISAATLFAAFPAAYAVLVSAFYLPVIAMLCGLILRGVAFEFRAKAEGSRWLWSASFAAGSIVAAFAQGATIGSFVQELPVDHGRFVGSIMTWLTPYSLWCGFGLVFGYALLGASWLVNKTAGDTREFGYAAMPVLFVGLATFLVVAAVAIFAMHLRIADRWFQRPYLLVFLAIGAAAGAGLFYSWLKRLDRLPLPMTMLMFIAAFATMVCALLPYIVPFSLTIDQAAAPHASLAFLFYGAGLVILPLTLIYTGVVYWLFRGRLSVEEMSYSDHG